MSKSNYINISRLIITSTENGEPMSNLKRASRLTSIHIIYAIFLCVASIAQGGDSTSNFMIELSTRSIKIGHEIRNNDFYLSVRSTNSMIFEDYLYAKGDSVINALNNYSAADGTITIGLGFDAYWNPYNFDLGIRTEVAYSNTYNSYHPYYHNTFGIINEINFIVNKRFDRFAIGAAAGPETTWNFGHWITLENQNGRVDKKDNEIFINLSAELFARVYL